MKDTANEHTQENPENMSQQRRRRSKQSGFLFSGVEGKTVRYAEYIYQHCADMLLIAFMDDTQLIINIGTRPGLRARLATMKDGTEIKQKRYDVPLFPSGIEWKL